MADNKSVTTPSYYIREGLKYILQGVQIERHDEAVKSLLYLVRHSIAHNGDVDDTVLLNHDLPFGPFDTTDTGRTYFSLNVPFWINLLERRVDDYVSYLNSINDVHSDYENFEYFMLDGKFKCEHRG